MNEKERDLTIISTALESQFIAEKERRKRSKEALAIFDLALPLHKFSPAIITMVDRHNAAVRRLMGTNGAPESQQEIEHWRSELLITRNFINKLAAHLDILSQHDPKLAYINTRIRIAKSNLAKAYKANNKKKQKQWEHYLQELRNQREILIHEYAK